MFQGLRTNSLFYVLDKGENPNLLIGQFAGGVENIDLLRQTIGTAALDHALAGAIHDGHR